MCGFCTKQDYILECLLHPYLIARGNPMMLISIRKELKEISVELSRIDDASEIDEELFTPIRTMLEILESLENILKGKNKGQNAAKEALVEASRVSVNKSLLLLKQNANNPDKQKQLINQLRIVFNTSGALLDIIENELLNE